MRNPIYRYNADTCRYEKSRPTFTGIFFYTCGLLVSSAFILTAVLMVHNMVVESKTEKLLRKENMALERSERVISRKLQELDAILTSLSEKDQVLHNKFFASAELPVPNSTDHSEKEKMLLADASSIRPFFTDILEHSDSLLKKSLRSNDYYAQNLEIAKSFGLLPVIPLGLPVKNMKPTSLFSGYGMRIHPFHKGLYHHAGVDIAVPRGTEIVSTAPGTVTTVKLSLLQAGYGNYVEVDHGNGFITRYTHLEDILVKKGHQVKKGSVLGTAGISGGSVAPHLHYEILRNGKNVDPVIFLVQGMSTQDYHLLQHAGKRQNQSLD